ncbi:hypothetical protein [Paenibacillus sp. FSL R7-0652]|uniref:hypothetical protein n=1 Tax=Paenibacillus sp. FSL R7-0652 TaxID=2921687 RepID=UPI00315A3990
MRGVSACGYAGTLMRVQGGVTYTAGWADSAKPSGSMGRGLTAGSHGDTAAGAGTHHGRRPGEC